MLFFTFLLIFVGSVTKGAALDEGIKFEPVIAPEHLVFPPEDLPGQMNTTKCGGLLIANGGFINYKHGEKYSNNERCIWTIRSVKWQTSFLMRDAGFHSSNDYLSIYVLDDNGVLQKKGTINKETGSEIVGVVGPTMFLVFTSDQSGIGTGFLLEYFRFGYNELSGYLYSHSHSNSPSGSIQWPQPPLEFPANMLATFAISPSMQNSRLTLTVDSCDLLTLARGCQSNFLTVHQLLPSGFILRLRYCERDLSTSATFSSSSPLIITYTASIGPQHSGISFSWREESLPGSS